MNRLWYLYFGGGLCRSLDDFGMQGEPPTHPELLDWLAAEFMDSNWNIRHMERTIVLSRAYRQSSAANRAERERDPANRLFARQGRYRLPAEVIRDQALFASGLLHDQFGGATSRPYQPAGYYNLLNFPKRDYVHDQNRNQYRRGVYVHWQRQYLHPMFKAFDAPSREECTPQRPLSNTPLAALAALNDPSAVEAARGLAMRMLRETPNAPGADAAARVRYGWQIVLVREPSEDEVEVLTRLYGAARDRFSADHAAAEQLLGAVLDSMPKEIHPAEAAAWVQVARALFNLHETLTRS